jgi:hypothetical protein
MSTAAGKMSIFCPSCGKNLTVPLSAAGKKGRCPSCSHIFLLEAPPSPIDPEPLPELAPLQNDPLGDVNVSDYPLQALPPQTFATPAPSAPNPYAPPAASSRSRDGGSSSFLENVWESGMLGGLALMLFSAVWFVGALVLADRLYPYLPILFAIGLFRFCRGLGNLF